MGQFVMQIDAELAKAVDDLVEEGTYDSRSDAVRKALTALVDLRRRRKIGEQIVEGYLRFPETPEEMEQARLNAIEIVNEEPW
jgi:Arc/MetJ-type ribon-helix-helix transcriptional regulator